jgi:S1-C subfamily serine protease
VPIVKAQKNATASPKPLDLGRRDPKKVAASDADFRELDKAMSRLPSAKEVLAYYEDFASNHTMTVSQKATFKEDRTVWESRAKQDLMRLGKKWVTSAELAKAQEEATSLIAQAYEMAKMLNIEEARKALQKASRIDPDSIAADFTLGLFNSITPPEMRNPPKAERHFREALRRVPGYVPALNNLALAEIRDKKYADGVRHLREAAERSPTCQEVTQNLGRFVSEARRGRIHASASVLAEATRLYSHVVTDKKGSSAELRLGWLFIPFVAPKDERDGLARIRPSTGGARIWDCAQGTGFVVEPHFILTCRHVVDDLTMGTADRVEVIDPLDSNHQRRLPATLVAMCPDDDLALLQCDQLGAAPLPLASTVPRRGAEILVIGFPGGSTFGFGLKTTRGIVTAVPGAVTRLPGPHWFDFSHDLWYDAATSHGASGAAVFEKHGNVVAVHAAGIQPGNDPSNAKYAGGVPAVNAISFIRQSHPSFDPNTLAGAALEWTDVDAKSSPSVVLLVVGYQKLPIAVVENKEKHSGDFCDDRFCTVCNGRARIRCPHCNRGSVSDDATQVNVTQTPFGPLRTVDTVAIQRRCTFCGGTGFVRCPYCAGGIDPLVR